MTPFLVPNVEMLRSDGPNPLTSAAYAEEFNEVKKLGSLTSTKRTADQTGRCLLAGRHDLERRPPVADDERGSGYRRQRRLLAEANLAGADGSMALERQGLLELLAPITAIRSGSDGTGDRGRPGGCRSNPTILFRCAVCHPGFRHRRGTAAQRRLARR